VIFRRERVRFIFLQTTVGAQLIAPVGSLHGLAQSIAPLQLFAPWDLHLSTLIQRV